ncbi:hypothetical protein [Helicobacter turcicus]|uniref:hypothetical protein n=1 Tax=Helicobacter turcicus TaxID=2867412 RepID=UPI001C86B73F|nr:hypothetical protein [Helicobacter turcicus]MBX7545695.1 hypothetical protein [Helicobacter turcicus]
MGNVVLLGGSNSRLENGLQKGIREGIDKFNLQNNKNRQLSFFNFAVGATTHIQNFYTLKRERNKEIFENAELIITESNVNETIGNGDGRERINFNCIYRNLNWYYKELHVLKKKILVILLPTCHMWNDKVINAIHKKLALKFGFNCIDMQEYVDNYRLNEFIKSLDWAHVLQRIMCEFGKNIISNLESFKLSNSLHISNDNPKFIVCTPKEMELISGTLEENIAQNNVFYETTYQLKEGETILKFNQTFQGFTLIGIHTWNHTADTHAKLINYSSLEISNSKKSIVKETNALNTIVEVHSFFQLDGETFVKINHNQKEGREFYHLAQSWVRDSKRLPFCDLVAFFLASADGNYYEEVVDFNALRNENIEIPSGYNHNSVIPPIEVYKEIIDEYCLITDSRKLKPLRDQINALNAKLDSPPTKKQILEIQNLEWELKMKKLQTKKFAKDLKLKVNFDDLIPKTIVIDRNTARFRIHNHLSYKLGDAMIKNSKSLLGYIKMPFVLWAIVIVHKHQKQFNQSLKFPQLESYPDYKEAIKEKDCFTYKLGKAFIKANNTSFIGGGGGLYQASL